MEESAASLPPLVVGIGEILWDVLPSGRHLGGAPANFAYYARTLGAEAVIASALGDDEDGRGILDALRAHWMGRDHLTIVPGVPTGRVSAALDAAGVPTFTIHGPSAWDFLAMTPELSSLAGRADAVCFGTLAQRSDVSRRTIRGFLDQTKPECLRVFDVNLRQIYYDRELVRDLIGRSRILKMNAEELAVIAAMFGLLGKGTDVLRRLRDLFSLDLVALTRGPEGSRLLGREGESDHPGIEVEVVDTVGAGDSFTAALVMGLLTKKTLDEVNDSANRLAASVCARRAAWPETPAGPAGSGKESEE
jgi:fructokinase